MLLVHYVSGLLFMHPDLLQLLSLCLVTCIINFGCVVEDPVHHSDPTDDFSHTYNCEADCKHFSECQTLSELTAQEKERQSQASDDDDKEVEIF